MNLRNVGYTALAERYGIQTLPHFVTSQTAESGSRRSVIDGSIRREVYPKIYWPGDGDFAHLEFALKYEGLNLPLLRQLLPRLDASALTCWIKQKPTGSYARRIWFLFEELSNQHLDLPDLTQANYIELADPKLYYTGPRRTFRRQRISVNLLGDLQFCVVVRRTEALATGVAKNLDERVREVVAQIAPEIFHRALDYLYKKETRSSYAIERETPDQARAAQFVDMLHRAEKGDFLTREALIELQQAIVDVRYRNSGWRDTINEQNFVAQTTPSYEELVHFIPPRPQEISELMQGWRNASQTIVIADVPPIVAAAAIAWTFVFLHPFSDGNGRIHRFLIHHVLARRNFVPSGVIFPVSAAMLDDPRTYDASLEAFSKPLLPRLSWSFDDNRVMHVHHDSSDLYRSIDCTAMAEALFTFVERTIDRDLPAELQFLVRYDEARKRMRDVVDLPDPVALRFIRFAQQNGWKISASKRHKGGLEKLTDDEITALETAVREAFEGASAAAPEIADERAKLADS